MRKNENQNINATFSMPASLMKELRVSVGRRNVSNFVAEAVQKALEEKNKALRLAYAESDNDPDTQEVLKDWEALDAEGWSDEE